MSMISVKKTRWALAALSAALLLVAGCTQTGGDGAESAETAVPVVAEPVTYRDLTRHLTFTGRADAKEEAAVVAEVAGTVTDVAVEVGQWVEKGAVLLHIDADMLQRQVDQAEAALQLARAGLDDARQAYAAARREHERMAPLYESGAISRQQWEQIEDGLTRARSAAEVQAPANIKQAEAGLAMARSQMEKAVITAPISGEVAAIMTSAGNPVGPGNPIVSLVNRHEIEVTGVVSDRQVVLIEAGAAADVTFGALEGQVFPGTVRSVSPAANPQAGGFPVVITIDNSDGLVRPGMFADVRIAAEHAAGVLAVSADGLIRRDGGTAVFVVEDGVAVEKTVETGLHDGSYVEVVSGLAPGDRVIVSGQQFVSHGTPVAVEEPGESGEGGTGPGTQGTDGGGDSP